MKTTREFKGYYWVKFDDNTERICLIRTINKSNFQVLHNGNHYNWVDDDEVVDIGERLVSPWQ